MDNIKQKKDEFLRKSHKDQITSLTSIPFFDIEYRTLLKIIFKNFEKEMTEVPSNNEVYILNKNVHLFERLFGFKFTDNKSVSAINNQSFFGIEALFPEIKESEEPTSENDRSRTSSGNIYLEKHPT